MVHLFNNGLLCLIQRSTSSHILCGWLTFTCRGITLLLCVLPLCPLPSYCQHYSTQYAYNIPHWAMLLPCMMPLFWGKPMRLPAIDLLLLFGAYSSFPTLFFRLLSSILASCGTMCSLTYRMIVISWGKDIVPDTPFLWEKISSLRGVFKRCFYHYFLLFLVFPIIIYCWSLLLYV